MTVDKKGDEGKKGEQLKQRRGRERMRNGENDRRDGYDSNITDEGDG